MVDFAEKNKFLLIFPPFYWFDQKQLLKQIQIFLRICPFAYFVKEQTFWVILCSFLRYSLLDKKEKFSLNIPKNASKQQESIVQLYVANFGGKKQFLLIFVPFFYFGQKKLFK